MWIAMKRMKIVRGGEVVWVDPGDPVPEASTWPNFPSWERQGFIRKSRRGEIVEPVAVNPVRKLKQVSTPELLSDVDELELKGEGECPYCDKNFLRLEMHIGRCKSRPQTDEEQL